MNPGANRFLGPAYTVRFIPMREDILGVLWYGKLAMAEHKGYSRGAAHADRKAQSSTSRIFSLSSFSR